MSVTATEKSGGIFTGWSGDTDYATIDGNTCTISKNVERDVTITANFAKKVTLTLSYDANGGANAPASQSKGVAQGSSATFTLGAASTPPQGYSFTGWKIGSTTYAAGASVSISANASAVAQYAIIPAHTVSFSTYPANIGTPATITTSPTRTESGVDYYADTIGVTIQPLAIDGYKLKSVVFFNADNPSVAIDTRTIADGSLDPFTISSSSRNGHDMLLRFNYEQIGYTVAAEVHDDSFGLVTAEIGVGNSSVTVHWGDTVTFTAAVTAGEGYSFAGWYDANGTCKSTSASYSFTVTESVTLYAKCKVSCSLSISYPSGTADANKTCSLTKDGAAYASGTAFDVVLGDSFDYALTLGILSGSEKWALDAWKIDTAVQSLPLQGTFTPSAATALVAHVDSPIGVEKTLTVNTAAWDIDDETGNLILVNIGVDGGVNPYTFEANVAPPQQESSGSGSGTPPAGQFSDTFRGAQYVRLTADVSVTLSGDESASVFRGFYDSAGSFITNDPSLVLFMADDRELWAAYGAAGLVDVYAEHADSESAARGDIAIIDKTDTDPASSIASDKMSAKVTQGTKVTFRALSKNGYEFAGWYDKAFTAGDPVNTNATFQYTVRAEAHIYAKFVPMRDRICVWEGSAENKTVEWTSKVYTMPRPFDPVAARVDATGYPVDLTVRTYSSPDKTDPLPVRDHNLTSPLSIQSQDGRRLPRMRPERFLRVTVKSTHEIDAVVVGTNMAEVN